MSEKDKDEIIDVKEELDGSAVIELPDSIPSPDVKEEIQAKQANEDSDEADERARAAEMADGGEIDSEAEALREAKRSKRRARKEYHKQVSVEKDKTLHFLERQNQELLERLAVVEKKTQGSEIARINKAIEDQETKILFAKQKIEEATSTGDGKLLTSAQEMWFEARKQFEALDNLKRQSVAPQQQQTIQAPDPMVQRHASNWMVDNQWYDPNGRDADSKVAITIDQALADEGWNPKSQEYWEELDNRLAKYLPHRYSEEVESVSPSTRRPKNVVTSSGRENAASSGGRGNTFTLTPDQVRAMKDAGMWDDPDKRAKMIRRYATEKLSQR
jgi:spore coat protein CotF